jgi:hypothetical protein
MRFVQVLCHVAALAFIVSTPSEALHAQTLEDLQKKYQISASDLEKLKQLAAKDPVTSARKRTAAPASTDHTQAASLSAKSTPDPRAVLAAPNGAAKDADSPWRILLRQDWQDIGILAGPTPIDKATGASISYNDDHIASNRSWAVHGTGAIVYSIIDDRGPAPQTAPFYRSFAAYATVNKLENSDARLVSKNVDTLTAGGALEVGWNNAREKTQNYLQFRGSTVNDRVKDTTAVTAAAAWIPVNNNLHIHHPEGLFGIIGYSFDPQLLAQYASTTDRKNVLLFSGHNESLRLGPQLTLLLWPYVQDDSFWSHVSANIAYHWWYEVLDGSQKDWFKSSLTYNFDKDGNFGLTGSYQRGHSEDTGTLTNLFMISLTGKM